MSYIVFSNFVHEVIFWKEIYLFPIYFYTLIFIYFSSIVTSIILLLDVRLELET